MNALQSNPNRLRRGLLGWGLAGVAGLAQAADKRPKRWPDLVVWAYFRATDDGSCSLQLTPPGFAYWNYIQINSPTSGSALGRYFVDLDAVINEVRKHSFEELPAVIRPDGTAHPSTPSYALTIQSGGQVNEVRVESPGKLPPSPELARFRAVWAAVWSEVSLRPPPP